MSGVYDMSKDIGLATGPLVGGVFATFFANPLATFLFVTIIAGIAMIVAGDVFWPEHHGKNRLLANLFRIRRK